MTTCGLLLIVTHPLSTIMHPMRLLTDFGCKGNV